MGDVVLPQIQPSNVKHLLDEDLAKIEAKINSNVLPNVPALKRLAEDYKPGATFADFKRFQVIVDPRSLSLTGWQHRMAVMNKEYNDTHQLVKHSHTRATQKHKLRARPRGRKCLRQRQQLSPSNRVLRNQGAFKQLWGARDSQNFCKGATTKDLAILSRELKHLGEVNPAHDIPPVRIQTRHPYKYKVGQLFEQVLSTGQCVRGLVKRVERHAVPPHYVEVDISGVSTLKERHILAYTFRACLGSVRVLDEQLEVEMTLAEKDLQLLEDRIKLEQSIVAARATYDLDRLEKETERHEYGCETSGTILERTEQLLQLGVQKREAHAEESRNDLDLFVALTRRFTTLSPLLFGISEFPGRTLLRLCKYSALKIQTWLGFWRPIRLSITTKASIILQTRFRGFISRKQYVEFKEGIANSKKFMIRILNQRLWQRFQKWRLYTTQQQKVKRFAMRLRNQLASKSFEQWLNYTRERQQYKADAISNFVLRWKLKNLACPFVSWVDYTMRCKRVREIATRMLLRNQAKVFDSWVDFVSGNKYAKDSHTIEVQRCWRGYYCRLSLWREKVRREQLSQKLALALQSWWYGYKVRKNMEQIKVRWLCRKREAKRQRRREERRNKARIKHKLKLKADEKVKQKLQARQEKQELSHIHRKHVGYHKRGNQSGQQRRHMIVPESRSAVQDARKYVAELEQNWKKQRLVVGSVKNPKQIVYGFGRRVFHRVYHGNTKGAAKKEFKQSLAYVSGEIGICPRCRKVNRGGPADRLKHLKSGCRGYSVVLT